MIMRYFIRMILLGVCITTSSYAQDQYATTSNGKVVLLRSNGTWEYVNRKAPSKSNSSSYRTSTSRNFSSYSSPKRKSSAVQKTYIRGPRGGCYYINSNGNKTYVDRSLCNR